jgi:NAD(P)-dependent dehydrogenase (short-subunit alcohol dehydrogenase family)
MRGTPYPRAVAESEVAGARILVVGASAGIGRAVAVGAVRAGAEVALSARRADALADAVAEAGGGHAVPGDITDATSCTRIADEAADAIGGLDIVVVAAGMSPLRELQALTMDDWDVVFRTNVFGASQITAACVPHLSPAGIVAHLSSDSAYRPRHGLVPYAASKAALEAVVKGWRLEHPELRFATVVIGPTLGTEFGNAFDPEAMVAAFPSWFAHGEVGLELMNPDEVASVLVGALGSAWARPSIDLQALTLRPPGPLAGSIDDIIRLQAEHAAQAENG